MDTISVFTHTQLDTHTLHSHASRCNTATHTHTLFWSIYLMEIGLDVAPVITGKWFVALSLHRSHCPHWHVVCVCTCERQGQKEKCGCAPIVCLLCMLQMMSLCKCKQVEVLPTTAHVQISVLWTTEIFYLSIKPKLWTNIWSSFKTHLHMKHVQVTRLSQKQTFTPMVWLYSP